MQTEEVVITGVGAVTPIGVGIPEFWNALVTGQGASRWMQPPNDVEGRRWYAAEVARFDPKDHVQPRKTIKVMAREIQFAFAASMEACRQAGIAAGSIPPDRLGTVFGSEIIWSEVSELEGAVAASSQAGQMHYDRWGQSLGAIYPLWMLKSLPNMAACHVGIALDARGPNNTITSGETSFLVALIEAAMVLQRGAADVMVVTGAGQRTCCMRMLHRIEEHYAQYAEDPAAAARPFDASRSGAVLGEGAAGLVLETRRHAQARGAKTLAVLKGWANVFDRPDRPGAGSPRSIARSAFDCVARAGRSPEDVDHVNTGANGAVQSDACIAQGLAQWSSSTPALGLQGYFGDSGPAAGAIESVAAVLSLQHALAPPTLNHARRGDDCPIPILHGKASRLRRPCVVKNSTTPWGHSVSVLLEQP